MSKILVIIDAQYDFINGSMAANKAEEKMNNLARYIQDNQKYYDKIIFTVDWHPATHISFVQNGGQWPEHCVNYTHGASIYQPIMQSAIDSKKQLVILTKGTLQCKEEYSILENYLSKPLFLREVSSEKVQQIDVCGIANEYCVMNTIKDLHEKFKLTKKINILSDFVVAIKDDNVLFNYAKDNGIKFTSCNE